MMSAQTRARYDPLAPDSWWFVPWLAGALVMALAVGLLVFLALI